jgi:hypothetical protein
MSKPPYGFSVEQKGNTVLCTCCPPQKPKLTGIHFVFAPFKKRRIRKRNQQYIEKLGLRTMKSSKRTRQHPMTCYPWKSNTKTSSTLVWRLDQEYGLHFKNSDKNQVNWLPFYKEKPTLLNFIKKPNLVYDLLLLDILDRKNGSPHFLRCSKKGNPVVISNFRWRNLFYWRHSSYFKMSENVFIKAIFSCGKS